MASGQEPIEFDPECVGTAIDNDEGESVRDSTTSITASLYEYRELHGRTYQSSKTTEYWAPNDQKHISAFDVAHQWLTMMLSDKLYAAPIPPNPSHILDIGTGTGIWAIDMADTFPSALVTGTDISPTQPSWTPPNLTFLIDDAQLEWPFPDNHFDFIHIRYLHGGITSWPQFYSQVFRCLKPGGYFQQIEPNIELRCDNPAASDQVYQQWAHLFYEAGDKINRSFRINEEIMTGWARGAGFEDITHTKFKIPIGAWPKDKRLKAMGTFTELYMDLSLDGFALFPIGQILGWTLEEVQALVANMRKAVHDPNNRSNSDMHMVYGRKPLA
ncbi:UMTA protein [Cercophora newfieldiana]|uniref:UMTA protein n=1 Tax=Cercophora newfieldiana TaxID=92897 RepID=A0AA39YCR7_9PEZI|nr:UMTA protein [Cercophora newfieldiana]